MFLLGVRGLTGPSSRVLFVAGDEEHIASKEEWAARKPPGEPPWRPSDETLAALAGARAKKLSMYRRTLKLLGVAMLMHDEKRFNFIRTKRRHY